MKIEEQSGLDRIIYSIFQREDIVGKIEKGERIKTNDSLEGWLILLFQIYEAQ